MTHKKVNIDVYALDIAFKLNYWVQITPITDFGLKRTETKPELRQETRKTDRFLEKQNNSRRHDAVIATRLRTVNVFKLTTTVV